MVAEVVWPCAGVVFVHSKELKPAILLRTVRLMQDVSVPCK